MAFAKTLVAETPNWIKHSLLILGASLLIGLCGKIVIPLPFTPVPIAIRGTLILALSLYLGSKRAPAAVAAFLIQGLCGLPVFLHGTAGLAAFTSPVAGYLFGYLIAAYVTPKIVESTGRTIFNAFLAMLIGNLIILSFGSAWLATTMGLGKAFFLGFVPFILGDLIKVALSLKILQWTKWEKKA
jgi:biotin transport system substrate-specific component